MIITFVSLGITSLILVKHILVSKDFDKKEEKFFKKLEEKDEEIERLRDFEDAYNHMSDKYFKSQEELRKANEALENLYEELKESNKL